jgi:hypothetical protein
MAKPIKATPTLRGKDARRVIARMRKTEKRKPNKKEKAMFASIMKMPEVGNLWASDWVKKRDVVKLVNDRIEYLEDIVKAAPTSSLRYFQLHARINELKGLLEEKI